MLKVKIWLGNQTFPYACIAHMGRQSSHWKCLHVHKCGTHGLKGLEEAVEQKVPDDFAILKGRNVPYEEIGKHSQRGGEQDPLDGQRRVGEGREETTTTSSVDEN